MADKYTPEKAASGKELLSIWRKKVERNFTSIFSAVSKHINGTADRHTADMIDYSDTETVGTKLEDASTKLENKVDKVSGKGLVSTEDIRIAVENNDLAFADGKKITLKFTDSGGTGTNKLESSNVTLEYNNMRTKVYPASVDVEYPFESKSVYISPTDVEIKEGTNVVHSLSAKANKSDVFDKADNIVLADNKKVSVSGEDSTGESASASMSPGKISVSANTSTGTADTNISRRGISVYGYGTDIELNNQVETHKLSNKVDKVAGKSLIDSTFAHNLDMNTVCLTDDTDTGKTASISPTSITITNGTAADQVSITSTMLSLDDYNSNDSTYVKQGEVHSIKNGTSHKLTEKANAADVGKLSDLATTDKSSIVAAINEVKSSGGGDVLDNLTYDSTNDIINSDANLLLADTSSIAAYNGTFRGEIKVGQLGTNKWAYSISPTTGFSTSLDVTCTSGNVVHNLASKADTTNVITKTNTAKFTPTGDYQPATKKYVDDAIAALKSELGLE